jgi:ElaB/YqjD/DUF883 family membrane-anchored ribosome-binding protein
MKNWISKHQWLAVGIVLMIGFIIGIVSYF